MTAAEGSTGPTLQDPRRTSTDNSLATDQQQDAFKMDGITTATSTITTVPRHHDMPAFTYCKLKHLAHLSHTSQICRRYASNSLSDSASERATSTSTSSLALSGLGPAAPTPLALLVLAAGSHRVISIGTQGRRTHNHPSSRSLALSISWS
jgi:hypothetical protein